MKNEAIQSTPVEPTAAPISKDLLDKVQCLRAIATCHNLIDKGLYPHNQAELVKQSIDFLRVLHSNLVTEVIVHPEADLVPEIKALKEDQGVSNV